MFAFGPEHAGVHNFMRRLGLKPYAIFPGPAWNILAVYVHRQDQPACILVQQAWSFEWLEDWPAESAGPGEDRSQKLVHLRQEGQALAERLGCPVACVFLIHGYPKPVRPRTLLLEAARRQEVTVVFSWTSQWPAHLTWIQPPVRVEQPALPPFPDRTHWTARIEPAWWLGQLGSLAETDDQQHKAQARSLAGQALTYLKETPARLLLEGPTVLMAARETLVALPAHLGRPAGRRYLFWVGFYLAGASLAGPDRGRDSEAAVLGWLNHLLDRFEQWSTRERRLVLRGLEMLAQKSADFALPPDTALGRLLTDLFPRLLHTDFLSRYGDSWRFQWRLEDLSAALARCGYVPPDAWLRQWRQHELQGKVLVKAHRGLIERLVREPSPDLWRAVAWARLEQEQRHAFGWHLYDGDFAPAFWDLADQEETLLGALVKAALARLQDLRLRPMPEALRRLVAVVQHKLQAPHVPAWLRNRLESALPELLAALGETNEADGEVEKRSNGSSPTGCGS